MMVLLLCMDTLWELSPRKPNESNNTIPEMICCGYIINIHHFELNLRLFFPTINIVLLQAAKYKYATLSTTGALIGGGVFGPLGLLVGAKLGALAAMSGGALGYIPN